MTDTGIDTDGVRIAAVPAAEVRPLRSTVLRPGIEPDRLVYDGDDTPDALHVAAIDAGGAIVGIASICREPAASEPRVAGWRLRGMATIPAVRGRGHGARLLRMCFEHVRRHGGGLLWCNARVVALEFYRRLGLHTVGEEFEITGVGPHYIMRRWLAQCRPARPDEDAALTAIAMRAKATHGYDDAFLERCRPVLAVTPQQIGGGNRHYVVASIEAVSGATVAGFHAVEPLDTGELRLDALFVEPEWMGRGIGRELVEHALGIGRRLGASRVIADVDPGAAGFYRRLGAVETGAAASEVDASRSLPRFEFALAPC